MTIPTLDSIVLEALDFFTKTPPPALDIRSFSLPFVVGSGNAINTGKILFSGSAAIFADESNFRAIAAAYKPVIDKGLITDAVVISASGEKDSVWELELARDMKLKTTLLTCKPESTGAKIADKVYSYKSIAEPYTYNTSTYLGMVLSSTGEKPEIIKQFITSLSLPQGFNDYATYTFVLPDNYLNVGPMVEIKGDELFGPHVMVRAFPQGHARHAKFVHPWDKELVITLGSENKFFGLPEHRWDIALDEKTSFGTVIALTYYLCGQIQKAKPDYFMQHIEAFCNDYGPKAYGKPEKFDVIVPANQ
ncbi:hypothetical protein HZB58_03345 [Candidatus Gottesmanbacteria bacterium]|nr:hypothetical protein [Candidatus Gottesmanbacteria bacterium]